MSTLASHNLRSLSVAQTALVSLNVMLKIFPMFFTGYSDKLDFIVLDSENRKLSAVLPFFMTNGLDLACLNFILDYAISFSRLCRIHLLPITDVVVTVRSSIYALIGVWHTPVFIMGPRNSISAGFTIIFMARVKSVAESDRRASNYTPSRLKLLSWRSLEEIIILEELGGNYNLILEELYNNGVIK